MSGADFLAKLIKIRGDFARATKPWNTAASANKKVVRGLVHSRDIQCDNEILKKTNIELIDLTNNLILPFEKWTENDWFSWSGYDLLKPTVHSPAKRAIADRTKLYGELKSYLYQLGPLLDASVLLANANVKGAAKALISTNGLERLALDQTKRRISALVTKSGKIHSVLRNVDRLMRERL